MNSAHGLAAARRPGVERRGWGCPSAAWEKHVVKPSSLAGETVSSGEVSYLSLSFGNSRATSAWRQTCQARRIKEQAQRSEKAEKVTARAASQVSCAPCEHRPPQQSCVNEKQC